MPLSQQEFEALPLLSFDGTEEFAPAGYSALQHALLPWLGYYHGLLWVAFFAVAAMLVVRYGVIPVLRGTNHYRLEDAKGASPRGRFAALYHRAFSLGEIESDVALRLFGGAILIGFLAIFRQLMMGTNTTLQGLEDGNVLCWPFFQGCRSLVFMETLPHGYSQTAIFMIMFGLILLGAYGLLARRIALAHACILLLFLFKMYITLISFHLKGNYDYYHTAFALVFLFLPHKRFFGSLSVVAFYFLSTATKIHEGWTLATYFTSMDLGLPLFPRGTEIFWTNLVIVMEMIGAWFLFSRRPRLQKTVFAFFVTFHLYSGILVGYHYPTIVMPPLLIFFGPLFRPFGGIPACVKSCAGWALIAALFAAQMISHAIPGDEKLTMEGNFYGLYMFEANHQCVMTAYRDGQLAEIWERASARQRCDPYEFWFKTKSRLCRPEIPGAKPIIIDHSINGGPFYRIVDEPDLCALTYKPFSHNAWIKTEKEAPAVGRPHKNYYW